MRTTVSALLLLWVAAASAQPAGNEAGNELVVSLYNQLQSLQSEVQTLRGLVEEQGYQLERLQTESRDRYIDIDRRLSEMTLSGGAQPLTPGALPPSGPDAAGSQPFGVPPVPAGNNAAAPSDFSGTAGVLPPSSRNTPVPLNSGNGGVNGGAGIAAGGASGGGAQPLILDDEEQYRYALNMLLEENQYVQAIDGFQSYIDRFPNGRRLTNALYWQGEALILESRFDDAIRSFTRLMDEFPQDAKAPGAMLKLGVAQDKKGDRRAAENLWRELPTRYPDATTEIKAAQDYLRR